MKRKLTTILCADVQRYSALMADDEVATLSLLNEYRDLMAESFARHDGRKVNTWGDAIIAEFSSVVEAVQSAVEVQDAIAYRNRDFPTKRQMWFRIGINLGDVMLDGDDLYGDGVNVAARLQDLAEPGGIAVSSTVQDIVHKQVPLVFDCQGEAQVKNIADPIMTYTIRMDGRNWQEEPADEQEAETSNDAELAERSIFAKGAGRADEIWSWLQDQPRSIKISAGAIGLFTGIGIAFDGLIPPNFLFPAAPFALYIYLHVRRQRREENGGLDTDG